MTEIFTRIVLRGHPNSHTGLMDWGEHTFEDMLQQLRREAEAQKAAAEAVLAAKPEDFDVDVVRGSVVQHHVRRVDPSAEPSA